EQVDAPSSSVTQIFSVYVPATSAVKSVDALVGDAGVAVDPVGLSATDHAYVTAPPSGSLPLEVNVTAVPVVAETPAAQVTVGGNFGQTSPSSVMPSQSSSSMLHVSGEGPLPPMHGPHVPARVHV